MIYQQFEPHPALAPYIDAYWTASGETGGLGKEKILPDGCIDILFNLGEDCQAEGGSFLLERGKTYLVGTMTRFKENIMRPENQLLGVRFKPGAFTLFYEYPALYKLANETVELEKKFSPDKEATARYFDAYLDHFFLKKLSRPGRSLFPVLADIQDQHGQITVAALAQKHFTTVRQLERHFNQHLGISPKEFINLVRYQFTFQKIRNNTDNQSLLEIAFECGYYDHSHLSNEIKKYTGAAPARW